MTATAPKAVEPVAAKDGNGVAIIPMMAKIARRLGQLRRWMVQLTRRAQGWKVRTPADFAHAVLSTASWAEANPALKALWPLGREERIHGINSMMQAVLLAKCGAAVWVDCFTDDAGALGECYLGAMVQSFRIDARKPLVAVKK